MEGVHSGWKYVSPTKVLSLLYCNLETSSLSAVELLGPKLSSLGELGYWRKSLLKIPRRPIFQNNF